MGCVLVPVQLVEAAGDVGFEDPHVGPLWFILPPVSVPSWMISLKVGSFTCWYRSMLRSRVYSEFSEIAPGGAFEQARSGLPATLPGSERQWYSLAQWGFCNSSGVRSDNRNSRTLCLLCISATAL